jgi:Fungal protein kinase
MVMVDLRKPDLRVTLTDLDLAGRVVAEDNLSGASARHRTLPFMLLQLLKQADAEHCLRHDLVSLFHVAVLRAVKGTDGQRDRRTSPIRLHRLVKWNRGTFDDVYAAKRNFLLEDWMKSGFILSPEFDAFVDVLIELRSVPYAAENTVTCTVYGNASVWVPDMPLAHAEGGTVVMLDPKVERSSIIYTVRQ